jgi:hypothetical protein
MQATAQPAQPDRNVINKHAPVAQIDGCLLFWHMVQGVSMQCGEATLG